MKKTTIYCDVCESEKEVKEASMQVIFTTEQTEGRGAPNNFDLVEIDLCSKCYNRCLTGVYIFASGAQGYNNYSFNS